MIKNLSAHFFRIIFVYTLCVIIPLKSIPLIGNIFFPKTKGNTECPGIYYNGYILKHDMQTHPINIATFELEQISTSSDLGILCINQAAQPSCLNKQNIPQCLKIAPRSSYVYYHIKQIETHEEDNKQNQDSIATKTTPKYLLTWDIKKENLENNVIPENSIILLIDPTLIALENVVWDILDNYIPLPKIVIKNSKNLKRIMTRLQFAKCTMNKFHEHTKTSTDFLKNQSNVTMRKKCEDLCQ
ncbi:MAG TPA: hypothetical protein VJ201_00815 [Candidatus Babeliales bacterium]|nr:hypothetical protein [Candidatus Babeliales bacterium]